MFLVVKNVNGRPNYIDHDGTRHIDPNYGELYTEKEARRVVAMFGGWIEEADDFLCNYYDEED